MFLGSQIAIHQTGVALYNKIRLVTSDTPHDTTLHFLSNVN